MYNVFRTSRTLPKLHESIELEKITANISFRRRGEELKRCSIYSIDAEFVLVMLRELISPREYIFLWRTKQLIFVFERKFPHHRPSCPAVLVFAQRRKLDRMNYHETWRIVRAWKPPLNEGNSRNGVTTVSDNNNVFLKGRKTTAEGERGCFRPFPVIFSSIPHFPLL